MPNELEPQEHEKEVTPEVKIEKPEKSFEERKAEFFAKHGASQNAPPELGGDVHSEANKAVIEQLKEKAKADEAESQKQSEEADRIKKEHKPPGSNVPNIIAARKQAEKERDDFRARLEEFENKTKPELDAKITELQSKIDSGDYSTKKEKEFQEKITLLETQLKDEKDTLVNENTKLKHQLSFYDIQQSEQFQKIYVQPVVNAYSEAVRALNDDPKFNFPLRRFLTANVQVLGATNAEERRIAITERNNAITAISDELDDYSRDQFKDAIRDYIRGSEAHSRALGEHEKTVAEIKAKAQQEGNRVYAEHLNTWNLAFKAKEGSYKEDEDLTEDEKDSIKDLKIDLEGDMRKSNLVARKTIAGETQIDEAIDIVHKGRVYPTLKAKIAALQKQVKDRDEVIKKLRGASTEGGESGKPAKVEEKETDREKFYDKFRPHKQ
jgi:plectin